MGGISGEFLGSAATMSHQGAGEDRAELAQVRREVGVGGESDHVGQQDRLAMPCIKAQTFTECSASIKKAVARSAAQSSDKTHVATMTC